MKFLIAFLLIIISCAGFAQDITKAKKSINIESYKEWRRIDKKELSANGEWVIYNYTYIDRDEKSKESDKVYLYNTISRNTQILNNIKRINFFNNGRWVKYIKLGNDKNKSCDTTVLMCLKNGKKIVWTRKISLSEDPYSEIITYQYCNASLDDPSVKNNTLVLWNIQSGDSTVINKVDRYYLYNKKKYIVYLSKDEDAYYLKKGNVKGRKSILYKDTTLSLNSLYFNSKNLSGTFKLINKDKTSKLYEFSLKTEKSRLIIDESKIKLPEDKVMFPQGLLSGNRYFSFKMGDVENNKEKQEESKERGYELELWSWNDLYVPSRQKSERNSYKEQYPTYVYDINKGNYYMLADENTSSIIEPKTDVFNYVVKTDKNPYKRFSDWEDDEPFDMYLIDIRSGETTLFAQKIRKRPLWTPNGRYFVYYDCNERVWKRLEPQTKIIKDISTEIGYPVYDEDFDKPKPPTPYGIAGWVDKGNKILIYDRYDIWLIDLEGKIKAKCITQEYGRKNKKSIRFVNTDYSLKEIELSESFLVTTFDYTNKNEGVYRLKYGNKLKKLMEGPYSLRIEKVTDDGKSCLWAKQSYQEFRNLWFSSSNFTNPTKITDANPQQKEYKWGQVKLVRWTNYEGNLNEGLLYLPYDYKKGKKYPVIVNFYETHSNGLNTYLLPCLSSATIDIATYVSKGYAVFQPDVHYKIGSPGQSAYNSVVSGTEMLINEGIADKNNIGIQGHSWSGYQVAYIVTKTDMFKCANLGAAVVNMVSAYTGFRDGSGRPRMFMYEATQSRMGKSLWESPEAYIKNSPIFYADKINTPLLIFHCDKDEAVPYSQGLDMLLAMRRLNKEAWLFNYKGERHFLYGKKARIDWTIRMQQFFDYYLKDAPMPRWLKEGINIFESGKDLKYEPVVNH